MRNVSHYSTKTLHLTSSSPALNHHFPIPTTPFKYLNKQELVYEHEEEEKNNTPEEDNDTLNEADYAAVIRENFEQRKLQPIEKTIHDNTLTCAMGLINKEEQYNKMKTAHKAMSQWISHKKENIYNEEAYDSHPF